MTEFLAVQTQTYKNELMWFWFDIVVAIVCDMLMNVFQWTIRHRHILVYYPLNKAAISGWQKCGQSFKLKSLCGGRGLAMDQSEQCCKCIWVDFLNEDIIFCCE